MARLPKEMTSAINLRNAGSEFNSPA